MLNEDGNSTPHISKLIEQNNLEGLNLEKKTLEKIVIEMQDELKFKLEFYSGTNFKEKIDSLRKNLADTESLLKRVDLIIKSLNDSL